MRDSSKAQDLANTKQSDAWRSEFGTEYSERKLLDQSALDASYRSKYALNQQFLANSFDDVDLALEQRLKYLETDNIDTMFLLNKRGQ